MSNRRKRFKGNRVEGGFLAMPYPVLNSPTFTGLSPFALKLLLDLGAQYRGDNNGDLALAWKLMQPRGWASQTTLHKAKLEAIKAGFLFETRKGYRPNTCSLFALTWFDLDPSPKHDVGVRSAYVRNAFKQFDPVPPIKPVKNATLNPPRGVATA
jgi:hypothetical protein